MISRLATDFANAIRMADADRPIALSSRSARAYGGRIRFRMWARKQRALVYQYGRFEKDFQFWSLRLGERGDVTELKEGTRLKLYLVDDSDFDKFKAALTELSHTEFDAGPEEHQEEGEQEVE